MGSGEGPAAHLAVDGQTHRREGFDLDRSLPVPELAHIEVAFLFVHPEGREPAQEDVAGGLHQPLPLHHPLAMVVEIACSDVLLEGASRQDLLAALAFLDAVDTKVTTADRERFERLREEVRSADDGEGHPEGLLHGNLLHAPDHAILTDCGPVAINWTASGRGPRLADLAYAAWGTGSWNPRRSDPERIDALAGAYRRHIEPTDEELERLKRLQVDPGGARLTAPAGTGVCMSEGEQPTEVGVAGGVLDQQGDVGRDRAAVRHHRDLGAGDRSQSEPLRGMGELHRAPETIVTVRATVS